MIILLFIESRLNFKNIPLNSTFKSSINYEYIVYRNENPISCFLEFLVSLNVFIGVVFSWSSHKTFYAFHFSDLFFSDSGLIM